MNVRQMPRYKVNPFIKELASNSDKRLHRGVIARKDDAVLFEGDGDIVATKSIVTHQYKEKNEFIKLYADGVGAILSLDRSGRKVFALICDELFGAKGVDKDEIYLSYESLTDEQKEYLKRTSYYKGINECLRAGIIAQSTRGNFFFINPAYIFNGNRLALVHLYELNPESYDNCSVNNEIIQRIKNI